MHRSSPVPHLSFHDISFVVVEDQPLVCMLWKAAFEKSSVPERQALVLGSEPGEALSVVDPENSPLRARLVAARESRCSHFIVVLDQYLITAPGERLTGIDVLQSLSARPWFREAVDDGLLSVFFDSGVNEDELRTELTSARLPADSVQGFFGKKMGRGFPTYPEKLGTMLELAVARRAARLTLASQLGGSSESSAAGADSDSAAWEARVPGSGSWSGSDPRSVHSPPPGSSEERRSREPGSRSSSRKSSHSAVPSDLWSSDDEAARVASGASAGSASGAGPAGGADRPAFGYDARIASPASTARFGHPEDLLLFAAGERPIFGTASTSGVIAVELGGGAAAEAEEENEALRQAALLHAVDVQLCDLGGLAKMYGGPAMAHKITSKGLRSFGTEADDFGLSALVAARNYDAVGREAHRLRGLAQYFASRAATLAAGRLGAVADAAERGEADAAAVGAAADELTTTLHGMETHTARAIDALKTVAEGGAV